MSFRPHRFLPAICLLTLGFSGVSLLAQEPARPMPIEASGIVGEILASGMRATATEGLPYSGVQTTITTRVLADGTTITRKNRIKIFRDSLGRIRREEFGRQNGSEEADDTPIGVEIFDPVAGVSIHLDPRRLIAQKFDFAHPTMVTSPQTTPQTAPQPSQPLSDARPAMLDQPEPVREDLGTQNIEGLDAIGTRVTRTIPTGAQGNDRPIQVINETWVSPDLKLVVLRTRKNPLNGNTGMRLTNISREEPPAELFQVPANYTVEEMTHTTTVTHAPAAQ